MQNSNLNQVQPINREQVKISQIPHIDGLTVQDLLEYARSKEAVKAYLPDEQDWIHLDRQWLGDVLYTIDAKAIQDKINKALLVRKRKNEEKQDEIIEMKPQFAQALEDCINFSTSKGKSTFLLKNQSKRKRTRMEVEEVKQEESQLKKDKQRFLQDNKQMKQENQVLQFQMEALMTASEIVQNLQQQHIIDESGNLIQ